jgi:hypothetical protein
MFEANLFSGTQTATEVDARIKPTQYGELMQMCEFCGHEQDAEKKRRCKHFNQSQYRDKDTCMWSYTDITGEKSGVCHCGYAGPY